MILSAFVSCLLVSESVSLLLERGICTSYLVYYFSCLSIHLCYRLAIFLSPHIPDFCLREQPPRMILYISNERKTLFLLCKR